MSDQRDPLHVEAEKAQANFEAWKAAVRVIVKAIESDEPKRVLADYLNERVVT